MEGWGDELSLEQAGVVQEQISHAHTCLVQAHSSDEPKRLPMLFLLVLHSQHTSSFHPNMLSTQLHVTATSNPLDPSAL